MIRLPGFNSKDRYIEEMVAKQERELEELRKNTPKVYSPEGESKKDPYSYQEPLTKQETGRLIGSALAAALLVGVVFLGGLFLFLLFCVNVWFA